MKKGSLDAYRAKRRASRTSEPFGQPDLGSAGVFVVQQHAARRMGRQSQLVQIEIARQKELRKERNRTQQPLSQYFLDVAREELDPDDFEEMWETAKRRRDKARESSD